jgi:hypothetical protein
MQHWRDIFLSAQMDKQNDPMSPLVLLHGGTRPAMVGGQAVSGGWWDHFEGAAYIDSKRIDMWLDGFESILGRFEGADTDASRIVSDLNSFIWRNKGKTYWSR